LLDQQRYIHIHVGPAALLTLAAGRRPWADAVADGTVLAHGTPSLTDALPAWFRTVEVAAV